MATAIKPAQKPGVEEAEAAPIHRIRITLTSRNVRNLEKVWVFLYSVVVGLWWCGVAQLLQVPGIGAPGAAAPAAAGLRRR